MQQQLQQIPYIKLNEVNKSNSSAQDWIPAWDDRMHHTEQKRHTQKKHTHKWEERNKEEKTAHIEMEEMRKKQHWRNKKETESGSREEKNKKYI